MGKPAKKLADDSLDDLGAVSDDSLADLGAVDAAPPPAPAPEPAPEPEHAAEMATFDDFMSRGEVPRTRGRGINAPLGATTGEAALRGAGAGLTLRHGDEAGGFGAFLAGHNAGAGGSEGVSMGDIGPGDVPRAAGRGIDAPLSGVTDFNMERDYQRQLDKDAEEGHPYVFGATELAGAGAPGALVAPLSAAGGGALLGGVHGEGASEATAPMGVARDTAAGAAFGAGGGKLLEAGAPIVARGTAKVGNAIAEKLRGGAETMHDIGTEQRLAGAGVERSGMRKLREKGAGYGSDAEGLERYAAGADRMGIGKGRLFPSTVRQHAEDAAAAAEAANARADNVVAQLDAAGTRIHGADVGAAIRKLKTGHGRDVGAQLEEIAKGFDAMGEVPWSEMNLERKDIGAGTAWDSGSVKAKLGKKVYSAINDAMESAAERAVPGAGAEWRSANEDFHVAQKLAEMGENKLNQAGNRAISPMDAGAAATGQLAGGPVAAGAALVGSKVVRSREHAVASNIARATEAALEAGARGAEAVSRAAPAASSKVVQLGQVLSMRGSAPGAGMAPAMADTESPREKRIAQLKEMLNGTGSRAADMATDDPAHGQQLAQEPQGKDRDMAYAHLVTSDPAFRARERAKSQNQEDEEEQP